MTKKKNMLEFKAILFWEVFASFIVLLFILFCSIEYIIYPLTRADTSVQTPLIIFLCAMLLVIEFNFYRKRSRNMVFFIDENSHKIVKIKNIDQKYINDDDIKNIFATKFLFEKSLSQFLTINSKLYLIYAGEALAINPDKRKLLICKKKLQDLKVIIDYKKYKKYKFINALPYTVNFLFYFIIMISFSLFLFLFIAILTDNTAWFNIFN